MSFLVYCDCYTKSFRAGAAMQLRPFTRRSGNEWLIPVIMHADISFHYQAWKGFWSKGPITT